MTGIVSPIVEESSVHARFDCNFSDDIFCGMDGVDAYKISHNYFSSERNELDCTGPSSGTLFFYRTFGFVCSVGPILTAVEQKVQQDVPELIDSYREELIRIPSDNLKHFFNALVNRPEVPYRRAEYDHYHCLGCVLDNS